ncbi:MAG: tetratricopeptide repeat protein [Deltaproteobacteria bacterium]|nr:tetratricopeptide repeat protein [Deltaproteobacteria bacterium]
MQQSANQNLILIEGAATYERILADIREVEVDEGLRHLKDFLKIYPDFARAHNDVAVMYYQTGNSLKALAHYEKAHKLDPGNITYRKNLADFYFVELEWTGDAIHTYLDILKDNPFDIEALNALGSISLQIGRREQARQYFTRTLQLDTGNLDAKQALQQLAPQQLTAPAAAQPAPAQIAQRQSAPLRMPEQPEKAASVPPFKELFQVGAPAVAPAPAQNLASPQALAPARSSEELYREALQLANAGKPDEAIRVLEKLLQQDSLHAAAQNDLGVLYQKMGETVKSRQHHEEAARLQPANKIFQKNLADLLFVEFNELEEALGIYVRLQAKSPQDIEILKAIATVCQAVGNQPDARFFLERVLALQPWDRDAQGMLKAMEEAGKAGA